MNGWKNWSQTQWNKWGSKLQPMYKKIDEWEAPGWVKKAAAKIWDLIDDETRKYLYTFVTETLKKFDADFAKKLIDKVFELVKVWNKKDNK